MLSLGYLIGDWLYDHLPSPADPTRPFELTTDQAEFVVLWYSIDERGRFVYRRGALQQAKGWGKSPLLAAIAIAEFAGPVVPDGLDANRRPVGRPWGASESPPPWVQVAASSEDQATSNVYSVVWSLLSENEGKAAEALGIDEGRSRLFLKSQPGAKLEAVTSKAGSREGQRVTFGLLDESHLMTKATGGLRLAKTVRRNAGKMNGRTVECSNAHEIGASSVAEETAEAFAAGQPGILYVANRPDIEPVDTMSDEELLELLAEVYGGSRWVDLPRILAEVRDPATGWPDAARYYFNLPGSGTDAFVDPTRWRELATENDPEDGASVTAGFLGASVERAALALCSDGGRISVIDVWEGALPRAEVRRAVAWCFKRFAVRLFYADPRQFRTEVEEWAQEYGEDVVLEFPTNSPRRMAPLLERFKVAVAEGDLHHDGDDDLARHIGNGRIRSTRIGPTLEPAAPGRPIEAAVAALLAFEARANLPQEEEVAIWWG